MTSQCRKKKHLIFIKLLIMYRSHVNKHIDTKSVNFDRLVSKFRGEVVTTPLGDFLAQENKG